MTPAKRWSCSKRGSSIDDGDAREMEPQLTPVTGRSSTRDRGALTTAMEMMDASASSLPSRPPPWAIWAWTDLEAGGRTLIHWFKRRNLALGDVLLSGPCFDRGPRGFGSQENFHSLPPTRTRNHLHPPSPSPSSRPPDTTSLCDRPYSAATAYMPCPHAMVVMPYRRE